MIYKRVRLFTGIKLYWLSLEVIMMDNPHYLMSFPLTPTLISFIYLNPRVDLFNPYLNSINSTIPSWFSELIIKPDIDIAPRGQIQPFFHNYLCLCPRSARYRF
jgi:hypothetical protein